MPVSQSKPLTTEEEIERLRRAVEMYKAAELQQLGRAIRAEDALNAIIKCAQFERPHIEIGEIARAALATERKP